MVNGVGCVVTLCCTQKSYPISPTRERSGFNCTGDCRVLLRLREIDLFILSEEKLCTAFQQDLYHRRVMRVEASIPSMEMPMNDSK